LQERVAAEKAAAEQQLATVRTGFEEEKTRYIGAERKRSEKIFSDNVRRAFRRLLTRVADRVS
jgi:hypothetical protein